jgi:hypothetical protein
VFWEGLGGDSEKRMARGEGVKKNEVVRRDGKAPVVPPLEKPLPSPF